MVSGGQLHILFDFVVGVGNRTLEIAIANTELDGNVAGIVFAIDIRGAGLFGNVRYIAQRNRSSTRGIYRDTADGVNVASELRQIADHHIEAALTIEHLSDRLATDGSLNYAVDIIGKNAVACGPFAIDLNQQVRLAQFAEDSQVGNSRHGAHNFFDFMRS